MGDGSDLCDGGVNTGEEAESASKCGSDAENRAIRVAAISLAAFVFLD